MCASPFSLREIAIVTTVNTQWEVNRNSSSPLTKLLTSAYWCGSLCTHLFSCILNSTYNILVTGAAADIALEAFAYLSFCRVGIVLEYLIGSHYHSRSTEATLQTVFLPEAFLDWVQATLGGKSFNSCHFTAIRLYSQYRACLTDSPLSSTVQAPHCEVSQPICVPVR